MHRSAQILAAVVPMDRPAPYLHWGFIQISVGNFIVILLMIVIFLLAIFLPFPREHGK